MARQKVSWTERWILGRKHGKSVPFQQRTPTDTAKYKSDRRRLYSRLSLFIVFVLLILVLFAPMDAFQSTIIWIVAAAASAWAVWFFLFVVITIPFRATVDFKPNGQRLALDTLISGLNWIVVCAVHYRLLGIGPAEKYVSTFDYIYFSTVTFSTLGYGDFSPEPPARPIASLEAIIGNLHLGVLVAAAFLVAGTLPSGNPSLGEHKDSKRTNTNNTNRDQTKPNSSNL
jgi:hypothetical protein